MINTRMLQKVVVDAKSKTNDARWRRAIDRAAAGLLAGELIVTTLSDGALVTSPNGTYHVNGHCECKAAQQGHRECYHRAAARLIELIEAAQALITTPRIIRSVERDVTGARVKVVRVDGWAI